MVSKYFMRQEERTLTDKYTYADIIIDPHDERVKVGEKYFFYNNPTLAIESANGSDVESFELIKVTSGTCPFVYDFKEDMEGASCCIIKDKEEKKKESQAKYTPFDLSKKEVRDYLRGKWIKNRTSDVECFISILSLVDGDWYAEGYTSEELLENFTFLNGTPVGNKINNKKCLCGGLVDGKWVTWESDVEGINANNV